MLVGAGDYIKARRLRRHFQREMARLFDNFDVLLTPAAPGPAPEGIEATGSAVMNGQWTLADFPTATVPYALASNGLPLGIQLSTPCMEDGALLNIASAVEEVAAFSHRPNL
jgi:Asp-tRNA(Asn)/Glu-tRNA(Gln) amidotransferase A subunit family amidase